MKYSTLFFVALITTVSAAPWCSCNPCGWVTGGNVNKPKCLLARDTCSSSDSTEGENECYSSHDTYECDCMINEVIGYVEPSCPTPYKTLDPISNLCIFNCGMGTEPSSINMDECTCIQGYTETNSDTLGRRQCVYQPPATTTATSNVPSCTCNSCGYITKTWEHGQMECGIARDACSGESEMTHSSCYSSHPDYACDCMIDTVKSYTASSTTTTYYQPPSTTTVTSATTTTYYQPPSTTTATSAACINVNHVNDNPGFYTCDCVSPTDPCISDGGCVAEAACPSSNGQTIGAMTSFQPSTTTTTTQTTTTPAPLTLCANKDDSSSLYEQLEEVFCLCDEYKTDGWTWARNELSDPLVNKIRALRDAHVPHNPNSRKFLRSWKRRLGFGAHLHGKVRQNKRERFYHKRMWRKVCLSMGRTRPMLRRVARRIDTINSNN